MTFEQGQGWFEREDSDMDVGAPTLNKKGASNCQQWPTD
ncbi:Uncharacterised protein [BD1-7 clade bacterium]|uniref:Uncharacterized protein n=1 Tax=BD1-7 clade bacterium TaxID=2029982 RepID=A0A5S9PAI9_9GAMM|nr:Uncharacterised protein [BD1-7 clade bacterium]